MDRNEYKKLTRSEHPSQLQEGQTLVVLTACACLIALVIAFKNILNVPPEQLAMDLVLCTCILGGIATSYPLVTRRREESAVSHPGFWSASIVMVTMAIIVLSAI
jgi:hypothetical protein